MRSSDRKMNEKLKAAIASAAFLFAVIVLSMLILFPYQKVWSKNNHYDMLFLGASRMYKGIQPNMVDEELGCNSYLIASDSCTVEDRYLLLESAIEQGTLKTVVLEVSADALTDEYENVENAYVFGIEPMSKLEGIRRKMSFCADRFSFWEDEYDNVYPTLLSYGFGRWEQNLRGKKEEKGYVAFGPIPIGVSLDYAAGTRDALQINNDYLDSKKECVDRIIELCLENDIRFVLINTPDSEITLWQHTGWEVYEDYIREVSEKYGIETYDFNLLKDRQIYLNDDQSYNDYAHLSEVGAASFTRVMADVLKRGESEDLSWMFYDSYEEAKEHLVYGGK